MTTRRHLRLTRTITITIIITTIIPRIRRLMLLPFISRWLRGKTKRRHPARRSHHPHTTRDRIIITTTTIIITMPCPIPNCLTIITITCLLYTSDAADDLTTV